MEMTSTFDRGLIQALYALAELRRSELFRKYSWGSSECEPDPFPVPTREIMSDEGYEGYLEGQFRSGSPWCSVLIKSFAQATGSESECVHLSYVTISRKLFQRIYRRTLRKRTWEVSNINSNLVNITSSRLRGVRRHGIIISLTQKKNSWVQAEETFIAETILNNKKTYANLTSKSDSNLYYSRSPTLYTFCNYMNILFSPLNICRTFKKVNIPNWWEILFAFRLVQCLKKHLTNTYSGI